MDTTTVTVDNITTPSIGQESKPTTGWNRLKTVTSASCLRLTTIVVVFVLLFLGHLIAVLIHIHSNASWAPVVGLGVHFVVTVALVCALVTDRTCCVIQSSNSRCARFLNSLPFNGTPPLSDSDLEEHVRRFETSKHFARASQAQTKLVTDLVHGTWLYSDRKGSDARGLTHTGLKVKAVYECKPEVHVMQRYEQLQRFTQPLPSSSNNNNSNNSCVVNLQPGHSDHATSREQSPLLPQEIQKQQELQRRFLNGSVNLLFHGTDIRNVADIARASFSLAKAERGLYGRGVYFAFCSEKADQYTDDLHRRRTRNLAMFLAEVKPGNVQRYDDQLQPLSRQLCSCGGEPEEESECDTILAGSDSKRFLEVLVKDERRVVPRYVVVYDRIKVEN